MRKLILLLGCLPFLTLSQNVDHWETVIFDNDIWKAHMSLIQIGGN